MYIFVEIHMYIYLLCESYGGGKVMSFISVAACAKEASLIDL